MPAAAPLNTMNIPPNASRHLRPRPGNTGFTLIELLVVITIIAILAGLTLSTMGYVQKKGARSRAEAEIAALSAAIDAYKLDMGAYPSNQTVLYVELVGHTNASVNKGGKVYFEPTAGMLPTNPTATSQFLDPWGTVYNYNATNPTYNVGFFDLWSTAGNSNDTTNYIRN